MNKLRLWPFTERGEKIISATDPRVATLLDEIRNADEHTHNMIVYYIGAEFDKNNEDHLRTVAARLISVYNLRIDGYSEDGCELYPLLPWEEFKEYMKDHPVEDYVRAAVSGRSFYENNPGYRKHMYIPSTRYLTIWEFAKEQKINTPHELDRKAGFFEQLCEALSSPVSWICIILAIISIINACR